MTSKDRSDIDTLVFALSGFRKSLAPIVCRNFGSTSLLSAYLNLDHAILGLRSVLALEVPSDD